jgi:hypothetical protein
MKCLRLFFLLSVINLTVKAQQLNQVVTWSFSVVKISDKTYEIHLTPTVQSPWHIYSQTSPKGGALATKFTFNKNPLLKLDDKTIEVGKVISKYEEVFGVTVKYFEGNVDFVQKVKLKTNVKTNISGTIEFMACTNEQCLSPKTIPFTIKLE